MSGLDDSSMDGSLNDPSRQCILYYSNPNFLMDQETTTLRFGIEEEEDDDDVDDDDDDAQKDGEPVSSSTAEAVTSQHRHLAAADEGSYDDPDDLEVESYIDYYDTDGISRTNPSTAMRRHQRSFQQRFNMHGDGAGGHSDCSLGSLCLCLRSRPCMFFVYVFVVLVLLSSFVSIVLVGVLVAEPFSRVARFRNATCRTVEKSLAREEQSCSCGKGCNSRYRCLRIKVEYRDLRTMTAYQTMMYEDETSLNRPCSFYPPCRSSRQENEEAVLAYERHYGIVGLEFDCWHSPDTAAEVIQNKRFSLYHVVNGIVWSVMLFVISSSLLLYMLRKTGCFC